MNIYFWLKQSKTVTKCCNDVKTYYLSGLYVSVHFGFCAISLKNIFFFVSLKDCCVWHFRAPIPGAARQQHFWQNHLNIYLNSKLQQDSNFFFCLYNYHSDVKLLSCRFWGSLASMCEGTSPPHCEKTLSTIRGSFILISGRGLGPGPSPPPPVVDITQPPPGPLKVLSGLQLQSVGAAECVQWGR